MFDLIESGKFFIGAVLCNGVGLLSSYFSGILKNGYLGIKTPIVGNDFISPNPWYQGLVKPSKWPPNFIFAPVWFSLYCIMGIGGVLILKSYGLIVSLPLVLFIAQLFLNFFWPIIFFNYQKTLGALVTIMMLNVTYLTMLIVICFQRTNYEISQNILKNASYVACGLMLLIPFIFSSLIRKSIFGASTTGRVSTEIYTWFVILASCPVLFMLLFRFLDIPSKYSNLGGYALPAMLFPTIIWTSFATYLNWRIHLLNRKK